MLAQLLLAAVLITWVCMLLHLCRPRAGQWLEPDDMLSDEERGQMGAVRPPDSFKPRVALVMASVEEWTGLEQYTMPPMEHWCRTHSVDMYLHRQTLGIMDEGRVMAGTAAEAIRHLSPNYDYIVVCTSRTMITRPRFSPVDLLYRYLPPDSQHCVALPESCLNRYVCRNPWVAAERGELLHLVNPCTGQGLMLLRCGHQQEKLAQIGRELAQWRHGEREPFTGPAAVISHDVVHEVADDDASMLERMMQDLPMLMMHGSSAQSAARLGLHISTARRANDIFRGLNERHLFTDPADLRRNLPRLPLQKSKQRSESDSEDSDVSCPDNSCSLP